MSKKVCRPVRKLTLAEAIQKLKVNAKPTLVKFFATWCGACEAAGPEIEKAACDIQDDIETVAIEIDEHAMLQQEFGIESLPTVAVVQQGKIKAKFEGAASAREYKKMANDWLKANGYKK